MMFLPWMCLMNTRMLLPTGRLLRNFKKNLMISNAASEIYGNSLSKTPVIGVHQIVYNYSWIILLVWKRFIVLLKRLCI
ncbi:unnamed protein product, partial [Onchocerca flexuosa]|uniref:Ovule protein n=1 Tax=Onchocerca flexuosa TaxID=387005 RepID=A0A183I6T2_9BILA